MSNPIDPINPKINSHNMLLNATRGCIHILIYIYIYICIIYICIIYMYYIYMYYIYILYLKYLCILYIEISYLHVYIYICTYVYLYI